MQKNQSDSSFRKKKADPAVIAARNARNLKIVRWYLIIYPFGRKHLQVGLDREVERRKAAGETPIEYFAPIYVEAKEVNGKIVNTDKPLLENYVFVHASIKEIFRMKQFEERYNLPRRQYTSEGEQYYPYISDEMIQNLRWISRSYSGVIPIYTGDTTWLIKGDRIRITSGPFKGVEAHLFDNRKYQRQDIMVAIDNWMSVPLLHVKEGQYKVIALDGKSSGNIVIDNDLIPNLHNILCRHIKGETTEADTATVRDIADKYANMNPGSDIMRCKHYSILLMAYTILSDTDKQANLLGIINVILHVIKAEQSKALLLTTMYGCTDDSLYHRLAHRIIDPWKYEDQPKKSKKQLIQRLADFDAILGH